VRALGNNSVSKHAFAKQPCSASCPIRKNRIKEIVRLEADIELLEKFGVPHPIATEKLDFAKHFRTQCNSGRCHE